MPGELLLKSLHKPVLCHKDESQPVCLAVLKIFINLFISSPLYLRNIYPLSSILSIAVCSSCTGFCPVYRHIRSPARFWQRERRNGRKDIILSVPLTS